MQDFLIRFLAHVSVHMFEREEMPNKSVISVSPLGAC